MKLRENQYSIRKLKRNIKAEYMECYFSNNESRNNGEVEVEN